MARSPAWVYLELPITRATAEAEGVRVVDWLRDAVLSAERCARAQFLCAECRYLLTPTVRGHCGSRHLQGPCHSAGHRRARAPDSRSASAARSRSILSSDLDHSARTCRQGTRYGAPFARSARGLAHKGAPRFGRQPSGGRVRSDTLPSTRQLGNRDTNLHGSTYADVQPFRFTEPGCSQKVKFCTDLPSGRGGGSQPWRGIGPP
jgi:hypothetical protein